MPPLRDYIQTMKQWISDLYILLFKEKAPIDELRCYYGNGGVWVEWTESSTYPQGQDDFRYISLQRMIANEVYHKAREK